MSERTSVIWNPLKKDFWKKDNLFPPENRAELKKTWDEARPEPSETKVPIEKKLFRIGMALTFALTLPIVAFMMFALPGLIIGGIIGILVAFSIINK